MKMKEKDPEIAVEIEIARKTGKVILRNNNIVKAQEHVLFY